MTTTALWHFVSITYVNSRNAESENVLCKKADQDSGEYPPNNDEKNVEVPAHEGRRIVFVVKSYKFTY